jgi:hypothetical protein
LYDKLSSLIPVDVEDEFADGAFDHPSPPAYYRQA